MTKKIHIILFTLFFCAVIYYVFSLFSKNFLFSANGFNFAKTSDFIIYPQQTIAQKITSSENGLKQLKILVKERNWRSFEGKIKFELADENCQNAFVSREANSQTPLIKKVFLFDFDKIPDSKDKKYCLKTTLFSESQDKVRYPVLLTRNNPSGEENSMKNLADPKKKYKYRFLAVRPVYEPDSFSGGMEKLNQRISQYKPSFLKGNYLYLLFSAFMTLTAVLFVCLALI